MVIFETKQTLGYLLSWGDAMSAAGCGDSFLTQRQRGVINVAAIAHASTLTAVPTNPSAPSGWRT